MKQPSVYYSEIDPYCAQWLANLMEAGLIPRGDIDTRSIEDVVPNELKGYTQAHFFAGLGGWPYALQLAGWGTRPVWTGSCPCQPFSAAGKGAGFADERHLWPSWQHLIAQCRPPVIFGEQVASKDADPWVDLVHADLEGMGYAFGCVPFPSAGVGAPHIRDRNYWMADLCGEGLQERIGDGRFQREALGASARQALVGGSAARWLEHAGHNDDAAQGEAAGYRQSEADRPADIAGGSGLSSCRLANTDGGHAGAEREQRSGEQRQQPQDSGALWLANANSDGRITRSAAATSTGYGRTARPTGGDDRSHAAVPTNGFWRASDWLRCTDGKWRPVEPRTFPLAYGIPNRVGRLRAYGNAIVPQAAAAFITAYMQARGLIADQQAVAA